MRAALFLFAALLLSLAACDSGAGLLDAGTDAGTPVDASHD